MEEFCPPKCRPRWCHIAKQLYQELDSTIFMRNIALYVLLSISVSYLRIDPLHQVPIKSGTIDVQLQRPNLNTVGLPRPAVT